MSGEIGKYRNEGVEWPDHDTTEAEPTNDKVPEDDPNDFLDIGERPKTEDDDTGGERALALGGEPPPQAGKPNLWLREANTPSAGAEAATGTTEEQARLLRQQQESQALRRKTEDDDTGGERALALGGEPPPQAGKPNLWLREANTPSAGAEAATGTTEEQARLLRQQESQATAAARAGSRAAAAGFGPADEALGLDAGKSAEQGRGAPSKGPGRSRGRGDDLGPGKDL
ncbi:MULTISPECIES: hypothetical protein [unclassified Streptomyces]|uniref:hypothetical protein n=1 Tax=unclassified Streptomyces TaxID=2593676 RepID=UPI002887F20E|nr:hypothetical protein [Streptomyces sp. DSM 41633]